MYITCFYLDKAAGEVLNEPIEQNESTEPSESTESTETTEST